MVAATRPEASRWLDARLVAAVMAVDPAALGGVVLRAGAGPVRDAWLELLRALLPLAAPMRRIPLRVQDERLLGGLDLAATLHTGHSVSQRGLLAEADGGIVVLAMAERIDAGTAARLAAVIDAREVAVARDGVTLRHASRIGVVALDEGNDDERAPSALMDRLAIWLDLNRIAPNELTQVDAAALTVKDIEQAREHLPLLEVDDAVWSALCDAAQRVGIDSMRAPMHAAHVARALAAIAGRSELHEEDVATAARWVMGPRARSLPTADDASAQDGSTEDDPQSDQPEPNETAATQPQPSETQTSDTQSEDAVPAPAAALEEVVLAAVAAAIPTRLLERFAARAAAGKAGDSAGAGAARASRRRGAPIGVVRGDPRCGQRLNLLATLRAAAPWQRLRKATEATTRRIKVLPEDFRVTRFTQRSQTAVIFMVDASGSAALHRLAEAKGAVELLLADCYARRDSVAVLAFRDRKAELLLPPTRSLVRAKRSLAGLPGGGGTPLAAALDQAFLLAGALQRRGDTPLTVLLTDGRANIARDGAPGRERAEADALQAAKRIRAAGFQSLLLDTSPRPHPVAQRLAAEMGALYMPLPHAGAAAVSAAVRGAKRGVSRSAG